MADMTSPRTSMPERDPRLRRRTFEEVSLGYTEEMAVAEANRCLQCKHAPCTAGCPVNVRIPEFIAKIAARDFEGAYQAITQTHGAPAITGRVCPQETQCEAKCVRGIKSEPVAIGRLERFAADWHMAQKPAFALPKLPANYTHVAVVGSGPAGLTCAHDLAQLGYAVTLFESFHTVGGVLVYGIPEFRLPKTIIRRAEADLRSLGVQIKTNTVVGRVVTLDELMEEGYRAIFLSTGAGLPKFMNISGEGLAGVYSANEYLTRVNLMHAWNPDYETPLIKSRSVAVVGGGNVAMDAARCAMRMGADEVHLIYRRSEAEMPARAEEVHHAKEEGIQFHFLSNPVAVTNNGSGHASGLTCVKMELGEADSSGRRTARTLEDSEFTLKVDTVIMALGTSPNPLIRMADPNLNVDRKGCIIVDEQTLHTSREGVYAGGDAVTGAATVILAMGAGKLAAQSIARALETQSD
ncbi:MAG: gltD [Oscillospiraceae bacterium]|nr:gltD [Oscillospiraceae bacterium]